MKSHILTEQKFLRELCMCGLAQGNNINSVVNTTVSIVYKEFYCCEDCKRNSIGSRNIFMVKNKLWKRYGNGERLLCIRCFQKRTGRKLKEKHFLNIPWHKKWKRKIREGKLL